MQTELDSALHQMNAAPESDVARLKFYERLADTELFILLEEEPEGDNIKPETVDYADLTFLLVFDREERLADFAKRSAPYVSLSGRGIAQMVAGQGVGLALNIGVEGGETLVDPTAMDWLLGTLAERPDFAEARPVELFAPKGLPEAVVVGIDRKLAASTGLAKAAILVGVVYDSGVRGFMLVVLDALPEAQHALANAMNEALTFSGVEAGSLDVVFLGADDDFAQRAARVGLRFDMPEPEVPATPGANPGMDPSKPPRIR
ncbi:SseB family protein [Marivivens sp. LCG002]|uniref:SseB family protein n=1 Tax=Marivivens sp. LCG002 TaxID=3051171 RepID=UPI0025522EC2|nr:SseB family protein [Marivivens sp. LCG002]WIV51205.1 SseB family protein [Marivivens sp. LCG002]